MNSCEFEEGNVLGLPVWIGNPDAPVHAARAYTAIHAGTSPEPLAWCRLPHRTTGWQDAVASPKLRAEAVALIRDAYRLESLRDLDGESDLYWCEGTSLGGRIIITLDASLRPDPSLLER